MTLLLWIEHRPNDRILYAKVGYFFDRSRIPKGLNLLIRCLIPCLTNNCDDIIAGSYKDGP